MKIPINILPLSIYIYINIENSRECLAIELINKNNLFDKKSNTLAETISFLLAASLIAFCTVFSSLCISKKNHQEKKNH